MAQEPAPLSRTAAACVYAVIALGAAVLAHSIWDLTRHPIDPAWLVLASLTVCTGWVMLTIPKVEISFSISDTFSTAAAVLFGPSAGAITAALDGLSISYRFTVSPRSVHRVLFNLAAPAIANWVAAQLFFALSGGRPLLEGPWAVARLVSNLLLFGAVDFLLNTGLVAVALGLERRLPIFRTWREHFLGLWVTYFGGVFAAIPLLLLQRIRPALGAFEMLILIAPLPVLLYVTFRHALGRVQDQISYLGQVNRVYIAVIEALAQAIDAKDQVTHDHIRRVQTEALRLARALGVQEEDQLQAIMAASLLHDVGKLSVPEHILNKPGRLTTSEYEVMKRHAPAGAEILSVVGFPYPVVPIVRHHHENWDGTGYPDGLAGEQIPLGARILSVVDCFDALTSHRPYRPRLEDRAAVEIIVDRRGTMYDPRVVDAFLQIHGGAAAKVVPVSPSIVTAPPAAGPSGPAAPADRELLDLLAFADLGRTLGAGDCARHLAESLWRHLRTRVPATLIVVYAHDPTSDSLIAVAETGDEPLGLGDSRIPVGERLSGWVAATKQPIVNSDARLDLDETMRERSPLRSALAVPVEADGRLVGVLTFYSPDIDAFGENDRRLAQVAAYVVARSGVPLLSPTSTTRIGSRSLETVQ